MFQKYFTTALYLIIYCVTFHVQNMHKMQLNEVNKWQIVKILPVTSLEDVNKN